MTKSHIHRRLINWGRYWRDFGGDFKRCQSLESKYIDHRSIDSRLAADDEQEKVASRPPAPEMLDAIVVNEAWKKCTGRTKDMLKFSFCFGKVDDDFVCGRCGIGEELLPLRFSKAVREIELTLDAPKVRDTIRPDNPRTRSNLSPPSDSDETEADKATNSQVAASLQETQDAS